MMSAKLGQEKKGTKMSTYTQLPIPKHFDPSKVGEVWRVPYSQLFKAAKDWGAQHHIQAAATDHLRITLMLIDCQITFCIPSTPPELFVGGLSGTAAIDDNVRLCEFIYRNLGLITKIIPTMDSHTMMQIFFIEFWIDENGEHPSPNTIITLDDVKSGKWRVNPAVADSLTEGDYDALQAHALYYVQKLSDNKKLPLMIWDFHAMLSGIGQALVPSVEEACFFHNKARASQTQFQIKGDNPLTENYSALRPEVLETVGDRPIAQKNTELITNLLNDSDIVIIAGQAKSHCVAWTIADLLEEILAYDPSLAEKIYLLEDCTSPVVIPGVIDFTEQANEDFQAFADAGMHLVKSTDPIENWPGICLS